MKKLSSILIILLFLVSCNNTSDEKNNSLATLNTDTINIVTDSIQSNTEDEFYVSEDGKQKIQVSYFGQNNKRYVTITVWPNKAGIILEQIPGTAFAKGADYGNKNTTWQAKGDAGTLISENKSTRYIKEK